MTKLNFHLLISITHSVTHIITHKRCQFKVDTLKLCVFGKSTKSSFHCSSFLISEYIHLCILVWFSVRRIASFFEVPPSNLTAFYPLNLWCQVYKYLSPLYPVLLKYSKFPSLSIFYVIQSVSSRSIFAFNAHHHIQWNKVFQMSKVYQLSLILIICYEWLFHFCFSVTDHTTHVGNVLISKVVVLLLTIFIKAQSKAAVYCSLSLFKHGLKRMWGI